MQSFLTFKSFISSEALILFYYLFAVGIPIALYMFKEKVVAVLPIEKKLHGSQRTVVAVLFLCFLLCELFLRMFFEFLIAYIQIRDALVGG